MLTIHDVPALITFAEVVRSGGYSAAARRLGRPRQVLHRQVAMLQTRLGVRLLEGNTRRLRATEAGSRLLAHAQRLVGEVAAAAQTIQASGREPGGRLRITAPDFFGEKVLSPVVARFLERWPGVRVECVFSLEREDLIERGFDLAIRTGVLPDSELHVRRLGAAHLVCCAAPVYLQGRDVPARPADLTEFDILHYGRDLRGAPVTWRFDAGRRHAEMRHVPRLASTNMNVIRDAAMHGLGIARLPLPACRAALEAGDLRELLPRWRGVTAPIQAVYSTRAAENPNVRAFLDVLQEALDGTDWRPSTTR